MKRPDTIPLSLVEILGVLKEVRKNLEGNIKDSPDARTYVIGTYECWLQKLRETHAFGASKAFVECEEWIDDYKRRYE